MVRLMKKSKVKAWILSFALCIASVEGNNVTVSAETEDFTKNKGGVYMRRIKKYICLILLVSMFTVLFAPCQKNGVVSEAKVKTYTIKVPAGYKLKLPKFWKNNYVLDNIKDKDVRYTNFYAKKCHKQNGEGFLVSVASFKDKSYTEMPSYDVIKKRNGITYVALYPTDVQYMGTTKAAAKQYQKMEMYVYMVAMSLYF